MKIDRIVTAKKADIITKLGKLKDADLADFKLKFKKLVD